MTFRLQSVRFEGIVLVETVASAVFSSSVTFFASKKGPLDEKEKESGGRKNKSEMGPETNDNWRAERDIRFVCALVFFVFVPAPPLQSSDPHLFFFPGNVFVGAFSQK